MKLLRLEQRRIYLELAVALSEKKPALSVTEGIARQGGHCPAFLCWCAVRKSWGFLSEDSLRSAQTTQPLICGFFVLFR